MSVHLRMAVWCMTVMLFVASGCTSTTGANRDPSMSSPDATHGTVTKSDHVRDTDPQVSDADVAAAVAGNTAFALNVFPDLDSDPNKNTVFSPYSITLALALTAAGAKGTTLSGIEQALSFPLPQDRLNPAFNKLDLLLKSKTTGTVDQDRGQYPKLNIVNAVWGQEGYPIEQRYLDTIATNYGADLRLLDFVKAPEDSRKTINSWVEQQTNSRIKDLIAEGKITELTRVVLTNAIWFKANWADPFDAANTRDQTFTNRGGSASTVPFMQETAYLYHGQSEGFQAVDIPYVGGKLSMLLLMPDPGTFDAFLAALTPAKLSGITGSLSYKNVALAMPKFTFDAAPDLKEILENLGMADAFDPLKADFSGINVLRELYIAFISHKAFISVDEEGTEAAAATAVGMAATGMPVEPQVVTIDHPFIFIIRDNETGLVLFVGKVVTLQTS